MKTSVFQYIINTRTRKGAVYAVLIDPDRKSDGNLDQQVKSANNNEVDILLVGGSLMMDSRCHERVGRIKEQARMPVVFFPGGLSQLNQHYDAMFFMSILSGRNPHYLIGEQVLAAPIVHDLGIETIPTGYLLFDGGKTTAVQFMSNTTPIPINHPDIAVAHVLAAQYLGMKLVYLEAGSGAQHSIPVETIRLIARESEVPLIVGGGIRTPEVAHDKIIAGAAMVVTGTVLEGKPDGGLMKAFADAVHISG